MSLYDGAEISKSLLSKAQANLVKFERAIGTPSAYSLMRSSRDEEAYAMHKPIKLAMRTRLGHSPKLTRYGSLAMGLLVDAFPDHTTKIHLMQEHIKASVAIKIESGIGRKEGPEARKIGKNFGLSWLKGGLEGKSNGECASCGDGGDLVF